jgi:hypothetical protein
VKRFLVALFAALLIPAAIAQADFTRYSPADPQKVDFVVPCTVVKQAPIDPIVFPGMGTNMPMSHNHTFSGNTGINENSTPKSLLSSPGTCKVKADHAAYWMPTVYSAGTPLTPYTVRPYYRAGTTNVKNVKPVPAGLKMIAGDAKATTSQDARIAGFQCRDAHNPVIAKQSAIPACPKGTFLEPSVVFPNCWNGKDLDSPDHKSHMAYANWSTHVCPAGYPVQIPQLTIAERFPMDATYGKAVTLATMGDPKLSKFTLHADFLDGWDPRWMAWLTKECINASIACEDVSDSRLPPHPSSPAPTTATAARATAARTATRAVTNPAAVTATALFKMLCKLR